MEYPYAVDENNQDKHPIVPGVQSINHPATIYISNTSDDGNIQKETPQQIEKIDMMSLCRSCKLTS